MTSTQIKEQLTSLTHSLIKMAAENCHNEISGNCFYVLSQTPRYFYWSNMKELKAYKCELDLIPLRDLELIAKDIETYYDDIYDINLYIHKAQKDFTVIEVNCYMKVNLEPDHYNNVKSYPPMLHAKTMTPPYSVHGSKKFDVNWEFGGFRHGWKLFWWKIQMRQELNTP